MTLSPLQKTWTEFVRPMLMRPKEEQVAAMCVRTIGTDTKVLLITSRDTGRWVLPKGWPIDGLTAAEAAAQEAWEEAGVIPIDVNETAIGQYEYIKGLNTGGEATVQTRVFLIKVESLADEYPEVHQRRRKWVSPSDAANMVDEPELKALFELI